MTSSKFELISFYKFVSLESPEKLKEELFVICKKLSILGTIIISKEGVNGMLAGTTSSVKTITNFFEPLGLSLDDFKFSESETKPFHRLRIKIKKELISLGFPELSNPNEIVGKYVEPEDWNKLIEEKDIVVLDTRNKYETSIGSFKNAILPSMKNFKEFPDFIKKNNIVFILWGKKAQEKGEFLDRKRHLVIENSHPSPFSAHNGFFGSKPFSKTNDFLSKKKIKPIDWQL